MIEACINNDRQAQEYMYRYFFRMMFPVITRYTTDEDEIVSIFNDGMLRVFKNMKAFNFNGSFEGWVRRIIMNTMFNYFRKYNRSANVFEIKESHLYNKNKVLNDIFYDELLSLLDHLPEQSSKVFRLYAIEGYSHKEIAKKLGISTGTSKWHLFKAKERLQAFIEINKIL